MAATTIIPLHVGKGRTVAKALGITTAYINNPQKTDGGEWVTSYECDPLIVDDEFLFAKRQYATITGRAQGERDVIAYHLRISFKPGEIDAATANKIGYDLAHKLTKGNHAFVCCTHTDKSHIHAHIVFNSTRLDCTKKFRNFKGSAFAVRRIADHLCIENGLSIIENPKPSRGSYANWQGDTRPPSNRERLEQLIDSVLPACKDYESFVAAMIAAGCEVRRGKHLSIKIPGAERFTRLKSLGDDYTEEAILERISGKRIVALKEKPAMSAPAPFNTNHKPSLLIDIQAKLQEGKGAGYEHWARIYNLKEMGRTLIFLQENKLDDYEKLVETAADASSRFNNLSDNIKATDIRLKEISDLQKQIGVYSKTREVYQKYLASGRDVDFYEAHRADLTLHQAARNYFDSKGYGRKNPLPKMDALKREYATLAAGKGKQYGEYKAARQRMIELQTVKQNADTILGIRKPQRRVHERGEPSR